MSSSSSLYTGKTSHGKMKAATPYSLHDELKKHLFQSRKERRRIVAEEGHFQFAFSCFQNFEVSYNCCFKIGGFK